MTESTNELTLGLINAIESGKAANIESSFNEIMANKLISAIDTKRQEIASGLFDVAEEVKEEKTPEKSTKPNYQTKSMAELIADANRAHVKRIAAVQKEKAEKK